MKDKISVFCFDLDIKNRIQRVLAPLQGGGRRGGWQEQSSYVRKPRVRVACWKMKKFGCGRKLRGFPLGPPPCGVGVLSPPARLAARNRPLRLFSRLDCISTWRDHSTGTKISTTTEPRFEPACPYKVILFVKRKIVFLRAVNGRRPLAGSAADEPGPRTASVPIFNLHFHSQTRSLDSFNPHWRLRFFYHSFDLFSFSFADLNLWVTIFWNQWQINKKEIRNEIIIVEFDAKIHWFMRDSTTRYIIIYLELMKAITVWLGRYKKRYLTWYQLLTVKWNFNE